MQAIITRYSAPTETRGARYTATTADRRQRVIIKEQPTWTGGDIGHVEAVHALLRKLPRWPDPPMIGASLNSHGDLVWVFDHERSLRIKKLVALPAVFKVARKRAR